MSSPEEVSLTAGECQKRIDQFIEVTKTDEVFSFSLTKILKVN